MTTLRKHVQLTRPMALILMGSFVNACTSWQTRPLEPAQFSRDDPPSEVRVTLTGGRIVALRNPAISGDSLIGWKRLPGTRADTLVRAGFALADVQEVAVQRFSAGKTTLLVVGVGVAALAVAALIAAATYEGPFQNHDPNASCPLVYSWDGENWRLDSGTFGGAIMPVLARTDVDNLDFVRSRDGVLRFKLANELNETDYVDAFEILAVDHDADVTVAPDAAGRLYTLRRLIPPERAHDFRGRDVLARVRAADGWSWESDPVGRDPDVVADLRDGLELAFPRPRGARTARLVIDGNNTVWAAQLLREFVAAHGRATQAWYDSLNAAPERARQMAAGLAREAFLHVSTWTGAGWADQGLIWEAGPEVRKRQVLAVDLSEVPGDTVRVRLESVPSFWLVDHVALDFAAGGPVRVTVQRAERAIDGRAGDVRALLAAPDGHTLRLERGDSTMLEFRAPVVAPGQARSYVVRTHGWYRLHTSEREAPHLALLRRVESEPLAVSRIAVTRMNEVLRAMELAAR